MHVLALCPFLGDYSLEAVFLFRETLQAIARIRTADEVLHIVGDPAVGLRPLS
jgi:hypothetical protein